MIKAHLADIVILCSGKNECIMGHHIYAFISFPKPEHIMIKFNTREFGGL
jgi:hypothetical protein